MEPAFNDKRTLHALAAMQSHQQLAFGAACCERMLPNYETFTQEVKWRDDGPLRRALDTVWKACEGLLPADPHVGDLLSECEHCAPDSAEFTSLYTSSAQEAAFAVCSLLDFLLDGEVDHIVSVPRYSTDSVDLFVQEREDMDPRDPAREQRILEHPLMQQELGRQRRDLLDSSRVPLDGRVAVLQLRSRAQGESNLTLSALAGPRAGGGL